MAIQDLISFLKRASSNETMNGIFQYIAAAVIYSKCIMDSFTRPKTSYLRMPDDLKKEITIPHLNNIAEDIQTELFEKIYFNRNCGRIGQAVHGPLASSSILSNSNIPYLKVFADHEREVHIRNGIVVLTEAEDPNKYKFQDSDQTIAEFPFLFFRNGTYDSVFDGRIKLSKVFGNDKNLVESTLSGKYITSINVHVPNHNQHKTIYEINTARSNIRHSSECRKLDKDLCESFAGIETENISVSSRKYTQKDVIITYFSSKLNKQFKHQLDHAQLDQGCSSVIQSHFSSDTENKMYIGFCYQTILDGYYSDEYSIPGSTTLLLLALTRGLEELYKNNNLGIDHQPRKIANENSREVENDFNFARLLSKIFKKEEILSNPGQKPPVGSSKLQKLEKESCGNDEKFLGATSRGITIKKSFPWVVTVGLVIGIISFAVYAGFIIEGSNLNSRVLVFRMLGTFVEVASSSIAMGLFLLKVIFLTKWEISDMLRGRIRTRSLKELCDSISSKRKKKIRKSIKLFAQDMLKGRIRTRSITEICASISSNKMEKKARAIKLLAGIPNPIDVFSWNHSCAFVDGGRGEFEIDDDITIEDLRKAGYKFGVNYYGQPIVADTRAQVRCVEFPDVEKKTVHISGLHEWQPKYIFELPTSNLPVAGTNPSSPFSETVAECV